MAFVNNQLVPWFATFAWLSGSTIVGLGYANNHGTTGAWVLVPIAVVATIFLVGFVVVCAVSIPFLDRYGRPKRDANKEDGGPRAG
jgi:hypothetical protein